MEERYPIRLLRDRRYTDPGGANRVEAVRVNEEDPIPQGITLKVARSWVEAGAMPEADLQEFDVEATS